MAANGRWPRVEDVDLPTGYEFPPGFNSYTDFSNWLECQAFYRRRRTVMHDHPPPDKAQPPPVRDVPSALRTLVDVPILYWDETRHAWLLVADEHHFLLTEEQGNVFRGRVAGTPGPGPLRPFDYRRVSVNVSCDGELAAGIVQADLED
jgi:hypothetical protein